MPIRACSAVIAFCLVSLGCVSDGQTLRPPSPDQTTTSRPAPVTTPPNVLVSPEGLRLTSDDFVGGGDIPADSVCDSANTFPSLKWSGPGLADGAEVALSLTDQSDIKKPLLLWLVAGIPTSVTEIESGALPSAATETLNDYGQAGFGSPCIDVQNSEARSLQFRVHVLSSPSNIEPGAPGNEAFAAVKSLTIDAAAILTKVRSSAASS